ncbi:STAS domain-containing protein [Streptomyces sp. NBC_00467]|uniref:STAS domain-containing protein n=1 Tax=Streptomyces sp. NBC_00467 TaxID=2975752 RepID=UPI002E1785E6
MLEPDEFASRAAPQVLSRRRRGRAWVVCLGGDLNKRTLPTVREAFDDLLNEAGQHALVVDAKAVQSADSAVIDLLLALQKETTLVVAAPSRPLQHLLATASSPVLSSLSLGEALDLVGT